MARRGSLSTDAQLCSHVCACALCSWVDASSQQEYLATSLDQEAATVLLARMAAARADASEDTPEVIRWLDRQLIKLVRTPLLSS